MELLSRGPRRKGSSTRSFQGSVSRFLFRVPASFRANGHSVFWFRFSLLGTFGLAVGCLNTVDRTLVCLAEKM